MGWLVPVYVAATDAQARREYESHLWHFAHRLLPGINISPPGYTSPRSALKTLSAFGDFMLNVTTWDQIEEGGYAIVGSPATVRQRLEEMASWLGVGNLLVLLQLATLPADLTQQNQELFAREVMPHLRTLAGGARVTVQPGAGV
jgi:alkanesulfonate monooxygenase SsuD/methylene tetrahydromethanopterin reductase-like flavin-dependent oxidoreductase (luciferase family)